MDLCYDDLLDGSFVAAVWMKTKGLRRRGRGGNGEARREFSHKQHSAGVSYRRPDRFSLFTPFPLPRFSCLGRRSGRVWEGHSGRVTGDREPGTSAPKGEHSASREPSSIANHQSAVATGAPSETAHSKIEEPRSSDLESRRRRPEAVAPDLGEGWGGSAHRDARAFRKRVSRPLVRRLPHARDHVRERAR
jgi:hypothetical protein